MKKALSFCLIIGSFFMITGCACWTTDVTNSNGREFWAEYKPQQKHILIKDVLLYEEKSNLKLAYFSDKFVENYKNSPNPELYEDLKVKGIVKAGAILKTSRVLREKCPASFLVKATDSVTPYATILTGEFKGKEVNLEQVSSPYVRTGEEIILPLSNNQNLKENH